MSVLMEGVLGKERRDLRYQLRGKSPALERRHFDHTAGIVRTAARQRDAAVFARSVGGKKKHDPFTCAAGALARGL